MTEPDAIYHLDGDRFVPTDLARGPWDRDAQHGGPVAALLARAAERFEPDDNLFVTRLSIELLKPVPLAPLHVTTHLLRPGRRVQLVGASVAVGDVEVVRATALRVARVPNQLGEVDLVGPAPRPPGPYDGAAQAFEDRADVIDWTHFGHAQDWRTVSGGGLGVPGPTTAWFRLLHPVVAGEATSGLMRAVAAADFTNGISSILDFTRFVFINPDLTVHVRRPVEGEWVCVDAVTWLQPGAGGYAESTLHDERGRVGRAVQSLYVAAR